MSSALPGRVSSQGWGARVGCVRGLASNHSAQWVCAETKNKSTCCTWAAAGRPSGRAGLGWCAGWLLHAPAAPAFVPPAKGAVLSAQRCPRIPCPHAACITTSKLNVPHLTVPFFQRIAASSMHVASPSSCRHASPMHRTFL